MPDTGLAQGQDPPTVADSDTLFIPGARGEARTICRASPGC